MHVIFELDEYRLVYKNIHGNCAFIIQQLSASKVKKDGTVICEGGKWTDRWYPSHMGYALSLLLELGAATNKTDAKTLRDLSVEWNRLYSDLMECSTLTASSVSSLVTTPDSEKKVSRLGSIKEGVFDELVAGAL
jgi:hypothetical protein